MMGLPHLGNEEWKASVLRALKRVFDKAPGLLPFLFAVLLAAAVPPLLWNGILEFLPRTHAHGAETKLGKKERLPIAILEQKNPFGPPPPSDTGAEASSTIVTSSLSLTLLGVALTPQPRDSLALIGTAQGVEHVYQTGAILPGGARLIAVRHNRVLIRYQGSLQAIVFHHHALSGELSEAPGPSGSPETPAPTLASHLLAHPSSLLNYLRPFPVYNNGRFAGVRLYPGPNATLFKRFGLRPGDILTAVNGVTLTNPLQGYNLIQRFAARHVPIILNIQRNGATLVISIPTTSAI